jgi:hypothetical protein
MAAVAGAPGLSALLAWPTEHLTEAADHWETVGERSYGVSHGVWRDALTVDWSGEAAEALRTDTHADMMTTSAVVDQLQSAASVARSGASDLGAARSQTRYAVEDARSAGFEVGEDLSVTDRMSGGSAAQQVARQAAAQAFAGNIGGRAAQLVSLDAQVAGRITAAVAGVGSTFPQTPQTPPTNGQVRAVDSRSFKQEPPSPLPVDPKDMTAQEAQAAWAEVNAEIKAWNARCGLENVGPLPPAQYSACMASRGPLVERQAAIRARLGQLGIPVDGEPGSGAQSRADPSSSPNIADEATEIGREASLLPKGTRADGIADKVTGLHLDQEHAAEAADIAAKTAFGETAGIANLPDGTKIVLPARIDQGIALVVQPDGSVTVFRGDLSQFLPYLGR